MLEKNDELGKKIRWGPWGPVGPFASGVLCKDQRGRSMQLHQHLGRERWELFPVRDPYSKPCWLVFMADVHGIDPFGIDAPAFEAEWVHRRATTPHEDGFEVGYHSTPLKASLSSEVLHIFRRIAPMAASSRRLSDGIRLKSSSPWWNLMASSAPK